MLNPGLVVKGVIAGARAVRDPSRLGDVLEVVNATVRNQDPIVVQKMVKHLERSADGRSALRDRPRLGEIDVNALARLPDGTLGKAFANHLQQNSLDLAAIPRRAASNVGEYIEAHLHETHDIWHAATGFGVDVAGELGLQAFYLAQAPGRVPALLIGGGLLNAGLFEADPDERGRRMQSIVQGWVMGSKAYPLFGIRWDTLFDRPLRDLQKEWSIDPVAAQTAASQTWEPPAS